MRSVAGCEEGARLLQQALAMQRGEAPTEEAESELPQAMEILLQIANGDQELLGWAEHATGASAEVLRQASIHFIEQVFFINEADSFRVLGLNPWAGHERVKEHYRLLIRLFHPDRGGAKHASAEAYTAMINRAYARLKPRVPPANETALDVDAGNLPRMSLRVPTPARKPGLPSERFVYRLSPATVLGTAALVAAMMVGAVYLNRESASDHARQSTAEAVPVQDSASVPSWSSRIDLREAPPPLPQPPTESPMPQHPADSSRMSEMVQAKLRHATAKAANSVPHPSNSLPQADEQEIHAAPNRATPSGVAPAIAPEAAAPNDAQRGMAALPAAAPDAVPTELELHHVIAQFIGSYVRGDLEGFMGSFGDQVRTDEPGGKTGLRETYARFFSNTLSRDMVLKNLQWQRSGELMVGLADYRVNTLRAAEQGQQPSSGTLRIEVAKTDSGARIVGFFHQATTH